jgi:hypothetical protein
MSEWKEVGLFESYPVHDFKKDGDSIEGKLKNIRTIPFPDGDRQILDIMLKDGTVKSVWGTTVLNRKIKDVTINAEVKIVRLGQTIKSKKGAKAFDYNVYTKEVK